MYLGETRTPTTLTPVGLGVFDDIVSSETLEYALGMAKYGVIAKGDSIPVRLEHQPYASIEDRCEETQRELWSDLVRGRLVIFTTKPDPPMGPLMESKLAYMMQKDVTDPSKMKFMYISDPRNEVDERMGNDRHPKCVIPRQQNVARRILYWQRRYPRVPILIPKRDVRGAFKLIPVSIRSLAYTGCRFAGYMVVYLSLFFGWKPSPANWGAISTLMMHYLSAFAHEAIYIDGPESLVDYQYVGDGAFIEPRMGLRLWVASPLWGRILRLCVGSGAVNLTKKTYRGQLRNKD